jgi:hypothetical protein
MKKTWEQKFDDACARTYYQVYIDKALTDPKILIEGYKAILNMVTTEKACSFSYNCGGWHIYYVRKKKKFSPKEDFLLEVIKSVSGGYSSYDTEDEA